MQLFEKVRLVLRDDSVMSLSRMANTVADAVEKAMDDADGKNDVSALALFHLRGTIVCPWLGLPLRDFDSEALFSNNGPADNAVRRCSPPPRRVGMRARGVSPPTVPFFFCPTRRQSVSTAPTNSKRHARSVRRERSTLAV